MIKLFEFAPTRSIKVRWTLQELGIPFEAVRIDMRAGEHRSAGFLKINPVGKLPALVDGDLILTESVAIVLFLAEKYPEKGFIPSGLAARAQLYRWVLFATTELEQPLWRISKHKSLYSPERRLAAEIALACEDFLPMVRILDDHMRGRTFVVGDGVTIADFVLAYTLDWANEAGLMEAFPRLLTYVEGMYGRPLAPPRIAAPFASLGT